MLMASKFEILSLILPIVFSLIFSLGLFYLGMRYQDYKIKTSHIREKAKEIDKGELAALKSLIITVKSFFIIKILYHLIIKTQKEI